MAIEVAYETLEKPQKLHCRTRGRYGERPTAGQIQRAAKGVHYYAFSHGGLYGGKKLKQPRIPLTPKRLVIGWAMHQMNR
jgi:hypothetical protein